MKSFNKMLENQPEWVVKQMLEFRRNRLAQARIRRMTVPEVGKMTKTQLKALIAAYRWDIIGAYFNFQPKFLTLPVSGRPCFDWASCPEAMADLLRQKTVNAMGASRDRSKRGKSKQFRHLSYMAQSGECYYCGIPTEFEEWTLDHMQPLSRGGGNGENRVGCCYNCNNAKGNMTLEEFMDTDYLPDVRRAVLGFGNRAPSVAFQKAKHMHEERRMLVYETGIGKRTKQELAQKGCRSCKEAAPVAGRKAQ